jgi:hypothetical protein
VPLQLPTPPSDFYAIVAQALSRVSATGGAADHVTNVPDPSRLNAAFAHKVYALDNSDIVRSNQISRARLVAWRVLIQYGPKTVAAMELNCDSQGANIRFASLDMGPFAQRTRQLAESVETFDTVHRGLFEPRMLRMPSVYAVALWLKDLQGTADIVLPMGSPQRAATGGDAMPQTTGDFVKSLRGQAETMRSVDTRPRAGAGGGSRANPASGGALGERSRNSSRSRTADTE